MSTRRTVPAGLIDAGSSALATFLVGLYAVRVLDAATLGAYALLFSAYATLMEVSARLVFLPAEIRAANRPVGYRLAGLADSLRYGAIVAVPAGLLLGLAAFVVPAGIDADAVAGLTATAMAATVLSPIQDHVRRMLHVGGRSWSATTVAVVQLVAVGAAIGGMAFLELPVAWQPFGALAIANLASGAVGIVTWHRNGVAHAADHAGLMALVRSGRWLLVGGVAPGVGGFGAAALVAHLVGPQTLGYAEAARVLARPIAVASQGLRAVLGPPLMRAGAARDRREGERLSRQYGVLVGGLGLAYLLVAGGPWALNPFAVLVPQAYVIPWLTASFIAVYIVDRVAGAGAGLQLLGAGRERAVAIAEAAAAAGRTLAGATAPLTGGFAVPIGYLVMSVIRRSWARFLMRRLYAEAERPGDTDG